MRRTPHQGVAPVVPGQASPYANDLLRSRRPCRLPRKLRLSSEIQEREDVRMTQSLSVNSTQSVLAASLKSARAHPITTAALTVANVGAATILSALFFQYGLGLEP